MGSYAVCRREWKRRKRYGRKALGSLFAPQGNSVALASRLRLNG